jgi:predicted nucleic acid-binding Zn ribbon protein
MTAEPLTECPECKGIVKRIIGTGAGPIFKGSGFYQTDYKSNSSQNKNRSKNSTTPGAGEKKSGSESKE